VPARRLPDLAAPLALLALAACGSESPTTPRAAGSPELLTASAVSFVQVGAGQGASCGLSPEGRAYCWGFNRDGELGNGTFVESRTPVPVAGNLVFRQLSVGQRYACGVTTDDRAWCWGDNQWGQLGIGTLASTAVPTLVAGGHRFQTITATLTHTCALTVTGRKAWCWGYNRAGAVGDGTLTDRLRPVAVSGGRSWRQISAGAYSTCAVTPTYQAYCWGSDKGGALGDGPEKLQKTIPTPVAGGYAFSQISLGSFQSCAVTTEHQGYCWGSGANGDGKGTARYVPRAIVGGLTLARIDAGQAFTCAESTTKRTYCWGDNSAGELGNGTVSDTGSLRPVEVVGGHRFVQVSAGSLHACGVTAAGEAWCWGYNGVGQLGDGTENNSPVPVAVR
jgi:alpha-tubulin suppressor-like RCC1 family protein